MIVAKRALVGAGARILFYPALLYNVFRNKIQAEFRWWDQIDQYLLLGAVPFPKYVLQLKQLGVGAVITLNEPYETLVPTSLYHVSDVVCADSAAGDWENMSIFTTIDKKMESSSVITPEDVLKCLMNDGTIDAMRLKIINQLKANEELKNTTIKMEEQNRVSFLTLQGQKSRQKESCLMLFGKNLRLQCLRKKASKSVWELILDKNGLGKEINETVEKVFCRLSGREPPLFPPNVETHSEKKESEKGKGKERDNGKENSDSTSKKRKLDEMNSEGAADEVASGSSKPLAVPDDSSKVPQPSVAT